MPSRLISDAHEWLNEIPTVLSWMTARSLERERVFLLTAGNEDPVELDFTAHWCKSSVAVE